MLDRTVAPPFAHTGALLLPPIEEIKTAAGHEVFYFNGVKQSLVKIDFIFKAGKWYEPFPGVSHFTAQMLEKGTLTKNSSALAEIFDRLGAHVEIAPGFDYTSISLYSLSTKLKEVLPLFLEIINTPSFAPDELELMSTIFLQNLKVNNEKSSQVAAKQVRKNIFGEHHPYGSSIEESHVAEITSVTLNQYFRDRFYPFQIYIAGQLETALLDYTIKALESLRSQTTTEPGKNHLVKTSEQRDQYIEKPGSVQTSIRIAKRTINRGHRDYFGLLLLNHILGGYFGSRLMKNIREEKGLTYGIYSSLNPILHDSFFSIGADVNKENQHLTIQEIKNELQNLREDLISEQELSTARSHFIGSLQLDMANPFSVVEKIKNVKLNQLDSMYYTTLVEECFKVTPEHLKQIASKYLSEEDLLVVRVG